MVDFSKHLSKNKHQMTTSNDIPGSEQRSDKNRFYANIINGQFAQRVKEGAEGAQQRTITNKQTGEKKIVFEKYYKSLKGKLDSVWLNTGKFGEEILIKLLPNDEAEVVIQISLNSREATKLLMKLPALKTGSEVRFEPYSFADKEKADKKVVGMNVFQNEIKIQDYYTPTTPNSYPYPDKEPDGKFVYLDKDDFKVLSIQQMKFLKGELEKWRTGMTAKTEPPQPKPDNESHNEPEYTDSNFDELKSKKTSNPVSASEPDSDLPFRYNPKLFTTNV